MCAPRALRTVGFMGRLGLLLLISVVTLAVALAAGCGGGDDEESATATWADGVCSAITTWTDSITSAAESLSAEGGGNVEERLETAVDDAREATDTLADDLEGLGPPDTEAGAQAEGAIDTLADEVQQGIERIEAAVDDVSGASEALTAVSTVSATLVTIGELVSSTFAELQQLDASGELEEAFQQADSCADLRTRTS
jgi:uncharacterized protein YoxC